jgi:hypothetical protein
MYPAFKIFAYVVVTGGHDLLHDAGAGGEVAGAGSWGRACTAQHLLRVARWRNDSDVDHFRRTDGCTRAPGTAISHVPGGPVLHSWHFGEVKMSRGAAWRHFMCSNYCK